MIDQPQNDVIRLLVMAAVYTALSRSELRIRLSTVNITSTFDDSIEVELSGHIFSKGADGSEKGKR